MNPPRNEEDVLDESVLANRHKGHTRAVAEHLVADEENKSSFDVNLSCSQTSIVKSSNKKTETPFIPNAIPHLSAKSTTDGRPTQKKSNGFSQPLSESLQSNTEPDISAPNNPNRSLPNPAQEPVTIEKNESPDQAEAHDFPEGGLRAWLVVLGSFSGMTASFGVLNSAGTFQVYLSMNQLAHESPSAVGWIFSLYAFLTFFCGVQIGPIFDAYGPRWLVVAGTVCLVGGMFGAAESTELWHFLLTYSTLCGIGSSLIFTPAIGSIAHFFYKRRAATTGLATTGGSIGGIVFPLMLQRLFPDVGFKWATRILAFLFLFLLGIANLLIRGRLQPSKDSHVVQNIWPDWRIFKDRVFMLTTAGVFFIEWALFIPLSYISSYALVEGVSPVFSYQLLAILNAGSFFGR